MKTLIYTLLIIITSSLNMQAQDIYKKFFLENNVVAHRGVWKNKNIPQNSIASLREAFRLGCAGSEFDVRMTLDSVLVICHDDDFMGKRIDKHTFAELSANKLPNGEVIPTLEQYLAEGMKQSNTRLFLEVKMTSDKDRTLKTMEKSVKMVHDLGANPWIFYISFDYDALKLVKKMSPNAMVGYLNGDVSPAQLAADKINGVDYNRQKFIENKELIQQSKDLGISLNVWTVNDLKEMDMFMAQGFEYITTDEPELLMSKNKQIPKACHTDL